VKSGFGWKQNVSPMLAAENIVVAEFAMNTNHQLASVNRINIGLINFLRVGSFSKRDRRNVFRIWAKERDAGLWLLIRILFETKIVCVMWLSEDEWQSSERVPETPSAFPLHAQRNAFRRRGVRPQSRSFARWNQLRRAKAGNQSYSMAARGQVARSSFAFLVNGTKKWPPRRNGHSCVGELF
jgi:hypothetical protein